MLSVVPSLDRSCSDNLSKISVCGTPREWDLSSSVFEPWGHDDAFLTKTQNSLLMPNRLKQDQVDEWFPQDNFFDPKSKLNQSPYNKPRTKLGEEWYELLNGGKSDDNALSTDDDADLFDEAVKEILKKKQKKTKICIPSKRAKRINVKLLNYRLNWKQKNIVANFDSVIKGLFFLLFSTNKIIHNFCEISNQTFASN